MSLADADRLQRRPQRLGAAKQQGREKAVIGFQRAKITSATAISPCPLLRPSFQLPGQ